MDAPSNAELTSFLLNELEEERAAEVKVELQQNAELAAKLDLMRRLCGIPQEFSNSDTVAIRIAPVTFPNADVDAESFDDGFAKIVDPRNPRTTFDSTNRINRFSSQWAAKESSDRKPVIGLNADFANSSGDKPSFTYIATGYYDSILKVGGIPIILPPFESDSDIEFLLERVDGLILVGGADLDPRRDGWCLHPTNRPLAARRELFDRKLAKIAAQRRIPTLGIGAGMQLLNVTQGGNLLLHIPEDRPAALPHHDPTNPAYRHNIQLTRGSIVEQIYGKVELRVNSMHHMAIDVIAPGFEATAWSADGIVEVIESTLKVWFAIGTQFHPESDSSSAADLKLFEFFVDRCRHTIPVSLRDQVVQSTG